jgi:hypothetical protein
VAHVREQTEEPDGNDIAGQPANMRGRVHLPIAEYILSRDARGSSIR